MIDEGWEIEPGVGVGPARFGSDRSALRAQFGPARAFRRANYSADLTDQYGADGGLMLTCDPVDGLYLVELGQPSSVTFRGVRLAGKKAKVAAALRAAGADPVDDGEGGWSLAGGQVVVRRESVTVIAPGYVPGEIVWVEGGATGQPLKTHTVTAGRGIELVKLGEPRSAVRSRLHDCMTSLAGPPEDLFWEDGLVVQYSSEERVERICVVQAHRVEYAGVKVMPAKFDAAAEHLRRDGHRVTDRELALEIDGSGVQLWLSGEQTKHRLPVSSVVVSAPPGR
jgi:hypothetical protein